MQAVGKTYPIIEVPFVLSLIDLIFAAQP